MNLEQGSKDWLQWRESGIGSSNCATILFGKMYQDTREKLWKEKCYQMYGGRPEEKPSKVWVNAAMERGKRLEEPARQFYERWIGEEATPMCCVSEEYPYLKASLDGYVKSKNRAIEIKAPVVKKDGTSDHYLALEGKIPTQHIPQLLHLCLVSEVEDIHFISIGDEKFFSPLDLHVILPFTPNKRALDIVLKGEKKFWECVVNKKNPSTVEWQPLTIEDLLS